MSPSQPAVGDLVARDDHFYEIAELRETLDGALVHAVATTPSAPMQALQQRASTLTLAGELMGRQLWR